MLFESFVLFSDLIELFHISEEVLASLKGNEELSLLAVALVALNSDGLGLDLKEGGVLISKQQHKLPISYLTRFSAAITEIDTAFPRA